jgi:hypothetical protein
MLQAVEEASVYVELELFSSKSPDAPSPSAESAYGPIAAPEENPYGTLVPGKAGVVDGGGGGGGSDEVVYTEVIVPQAATPATPPPARKAPAPVLKAAKAAKARAPSGGDGGVKRSVKLGQFKAGCAFQLPSRFRYPFPYRFRCTFKGPLGKPSHTMSIYFEASTWKKPRVVCRGCSNRCAAARTRDGACVCNKLCFVCCNML